MGEALAINGGPKAVPTDIPRRWPCITDADKQAVMRAMDYGINSDDTPEIDALQEEWAAYLRGEQSKEESSGSGGRAGAPTPQRAADVFLA